MNDLVRRFESFVTSVDGYENIDDLLKGAEPHGKKRADYLFANRQIIVEQKVLESDPIEKPQKFVDKLMNKRELLVFGRQPTKVIFSGRPDLQRKMVLDVARTIDDDVADADKQTSDTRRLFGIPDAIGILVLLNESDSSYT